MGVFSVFSVFVWSREEFLEKDEVEGFRYAGWDFLFFIVFLLILIIGLSNEKVKLLGFDFRGYLIFYFKKYDFLFK